MPGSLGGVSVRRIVSLVPSLTEAVGETAPELLVGVTDWCTHPPGLDCARVRGTKNPDVDAIEALAPDVVLAAFEENRQPDLDELRARGLEVWVSDIRDVDSALTSLAAMLERCGLGRPDWLAAAEAAWAQPAPTPRRKVAVPIWRKPWMVAGADTFTTSVLDRLGLDNVFDDPPADASERYPKADPDEVRVRGAELIVLPDEPYVFTALDGPEAFPGLDVALVSGRLLTWYGPSMATAREELLAAIAAARPGEDWAVDRG
ncbi:helical backbone metal receptor [Sporichthya polymorpha]|uniref:helical backbone metal receptor n=1 Tax=Sporichthya polymorpha TaxID=35751 RepID=UPI0005245047